MPIRDLPAAARRMAAALSLQAQAILHWRPDRFTLTLAGLALLGAALILARQVNYGVGLLWAAVFTALACLTRYIGLTLPMTIFLLLHLQRNTESMTKVKHSTAYALISTAPLSLWILRNIWVDGKPTGQIDWAQIHALTKTVWNFLGFGQPSTPNPPAPNPLLEILSIRLNDLASWAFFDLPLGEFHRFTVVLTGITLLALAIALGGILRAQQKAAAWIGWSPFCVFSAFALVYLVSLLMAGVTTHVDLHTRHLSPMYIPLLFTAVFGMDRFLRAERQRKLLGTLGDLPFIRTTVQGRVKQVSLLTVLLSAALSLWLGWAVPINARAIRQANEPNYVTRYAESEVFQYMREHSIDGAIVTNALRWLVYWYTDTAAHHHLYLANLKNISHWPAFMFASPYNGRHADYHHISSSQEYWDRYMVRQFIGNAEDDVYLVWFYNRFYNTPNLDVLPELEPVAELTDGVILKVNKAYGNADAYRAITATQPFVRSNFDLHLNDNTLHYVRDTCRPADTQAHFFLHIIPHDTNDLPQHRQQYGFVNLDFDFYEHGVRFNGKCLASVPLPDYPIVYIKTGQGIPPSEDQLWQGEAILNVNNVYGAEVYQSIVADQAVLRSHFDIYLNDNTLHYVRDTCRPDDIQARFFLHITPHDINDLPQHRQQYGFDNLDFTFYKHVVRFDEKCLASVPLPDYPIARINTGQWMRGEGKLWEGEFPFPKE